MIVSEKRAIKIFKSVTKPVRNLIVVNASGLSIEDMEQKLIELEAQILKNLIKELKITINK